MTITWGLVGTTMDNPTSWIEQQNSKARRNFSSSSDWEIWDRPIILGDYGEMVPELCEFFGLTGLVLWHSMGRCRVQTWGCYNLAGFLKLLGVESRVAMIPCCDTSMLYFNMF